MITPIQLFSLYSKWLLASINSLFLNSIIFLEAKGCGITRKALQEKVIGREVGNN